MKYLSKAGSECLVRNIEGKATRSISPRPQSRLDLDKVLECDWSAIAETKIIPRRMVARR